MKECLLNFVQDLFKFPWTREEFLRCNSFRESYDVFHDRLGDCSFEEYVEFFKEFNLECSTLEKSIGKLSDEQLEQISGGGIGRFIAIPMVALTLLSGAANVTSFASINAPIAVSAKARANTQATVQDEWEKTKDFVARAGDPWLSMLPVEGEDGFDKYTEPEVEVDENGEKVVLGMKKKDEKGNVIRENVYPKILETVNGLIKAADGDKKSNLKKDLKRAKYIYEWIAKKIKYDYTLCKSNVPNERPYRANPGVVFERKDGICAGFAKLANLMMRMADIPCTFVASPLNESGVGHGFNAIYIEKTNKDKGWTLMDATWGSAEDDKKDDSIIDSIVNIVKRLSGKTKQFLDKTDKTNLHTYFPAAYDNESLEKNNRSMIRGIAHQVKYIENGKNNYENSYILNGVKYTVNDNSISVSSEKAGARLSLQIPESIIALNKKIVIGEGIEKYKCSGTEEIDTSKATDLREINTDDSRISNDTNAPKKYTVASGILYKNDIKGNKQAVGFLSEIDGVHYSIDEYSIYVYSELEKPVDLKINKEIIDMYKNKPILIGPGIETYICSGDEEIKIMFAHNLRSIKTSESGKYSKFEDGKLYDKSGQVVGEIK